jgi:hypothetical protein
VPLKVLNQIVFPIDLIEPQNRKSDVLGRAVFLRRQRSHQNLLDETVRKLAHPMGGQDKKLDEHRSTTLCRIGLWKRTAYSVSKDYRYAINVAGIECQPYANIYQRCRRSGSRSDYSLSVIRNPNIIKMRGTCPFDTKFRMLDRSYDIMSTRLVNGRSKYRGRTEVGHRRNWHLQRNRRYDLACALSSIFTISSKYKLSQ